MIDEEYVKNLESHVEELEKGLADALKWKPVWHFNLSTKLHVFGFGTYVCGNVQLIVNENGLKKTIYVAQCICNINNSIRCATLEEAKLMVEKWADEWIRTV